MDFAEIKLEPEDMHDSIVDVSEQIENNYDRSEITQNVERSGQRRAGKLFLICKNS